MSSRLRNVFILALDDLEYEVVTKLKLRALLQSVYGYIDVGSLRSLLTSIIWTCFITQRVKSLKSMVYILDGVSHVISCSTSSLIG